MRMEHLKKEEELFLSQMLTKLQGEIDSLELTLDEKHKKILEMKQELWDSLSEHEFYRFGYEINKQFETIDDQLSGAEIKLSRYKLYKKMLDSPYFGRIDFMYDGETEAETYYIGVGSFYPKSARQPLIYDWRAPISSLYYDYDKGFAEFTAPAGIIQGNITRKLQYMIHNGVLEYFFENDIKIDDDILKKELGLHSNAQLKSIVATIQKEQNQIIRNDKDRILVVGGSAGSGKTSIALHRIAYILYKKRKEIKAQDILILTPTPVFSDYISHILPELGEEHIMEMNFDDFAEKELEGIATIEDRYNYLDTYLSLPKDSIERKDSFTRKLKKESKAYIDALNLYCKNLEQNIGNFTDLSYKKISRESNQIQNLFLEKFTLIPLLKRLDTIADYIIDEEETLLGKQLDIIVAEVIRRKITDMYRVTDLIAIYNDFLIEQGEATISLETRHIPYEDVYPLLYLKYLLLGRNQYKQVKHLVIDEMQDYSYIQYALLHKLFPCSMTILGDINQVASEEPSQVLEFLPEIFDQNLRTIRLNKSYRSTYEIATFASNLIDLTGNEYVTRHGKEVTIEPMNSEEEFVDQLCNNIKTQEDYETIAILCTTKSEANALYEALLKRIHVTLLTEESKWFSKGVIVTTFYLAKGLEFDAVHIPYTSQEMYQSPLGRQILYIACTRALHELNLYEK